MGFAASALNKFVIYWEFKMADFSVRYLPDESRNNKIYALLVLRIKCLFNPF
jgi:hypothetical protein